MQGGDDMNHELNLSPEPEEKRTIKKILFSGPRAEHFAVQAKNLWSHLYNDARSMFRAEDPKHVHPHIDVLENRSLYDIRVDLPGVDANSIELLTDGKILHIKAKRRCEESAELKMAHCEHRSETYERDIRLADDAVVEEKSATFAEGVLSIRIPRKAA
jgi:HSP20 family protein